MGCVKRGKENFVLLGIIFGGGGVCYGVFCSFFAVFFFFLYGGGLWDVEWVFDDVD